MQGWCDGKWPPNWHRVNRRFIETSRLSRASLTLRKIRKNHQSWRLICVGDVSKNRWVLVFRSRSTWRSRCIAWCRAFIASRRATLAGNLITDISEDADSRFPLSFRCLSAIKRRNTLDFRPRDVRFLGDNTFRNTSRRRWLSFLIKLALTQN